MKSIKYLLFFFAFAVITVVNAQDPPPPLPPSGGGTPAPGLPIDDNIVILFVMALFIGSYTIYKRVRRNKFNTQK